jgi:pimeloyl-ACP methyl ester carboxylesterase
MTRRWLALLASVSVIAFGWTPAAASAQPQAQAPDILHAPTLVAHTVAGDVGYRDVGYGSPIVLITGVGASMDNWDPSFVDALAASHRVIVFDNAGVGETSPLHGPVTITGMAEQTSAFIAALRLRRPALLGWSMGGMIAQALAVIRPWQVGSLILAGSQSGDGRALPIPQSVIDELNSTDLATVLALLFPADQQAAGLAYFEAIIGYPNFYAASPEVKNAQLTASLRWIAGDELTGHFNFLIGVPTLVADGTQDVFDPVANAYELAGSIRGARLALYPDAGHAFLFQDASSFVPLVESIIG